MAEQHRLVVKKYIFDNNIDYLDNDSRFTERRFQQSLNTALAVAHFYKHNWHKDFMEKDVLTVLARMSSRDLYVVELETLSPKSSIHRGEVVAACMINSFDLPVRNQTDLCMIRIIPMIEAGGMRAVLEGFNLQRLMHSVRLLDKLCDDPHGYYFAAIYADSDVSQYNLPRFKMNEIVEPFPELAKSRLSELEKKDERYRGVKWFRANVETVVHMAGILTHVRESPVVKRSFRPGETFKYPDVVEAEIVFGQGIDERIFRHAKDIAAKSPTNIKEIEETLGVDIGEWFIEEGGQLDEHEEVAAVDGQSVSPEQGLS